MTVGPSKIGLRERLRVCRGEARNQLRGLKEGGSARRGAMLCLPADLTPHAVQRTLHPVVGFENGEACAPRRAKRCGDEQGKRFSVGLTTLVSAFCRFHARTSAAVPGKTERIVTTAHRRDRSRPQRHKSGQQRRYRRFVAARTMRNCAVATTM